MIPIWYIGLVVGSILAAYLGSRVFTSRAIDERLFLVLAIGTYVLTRILSAVVLYGVVGYEGTWDLNVNFYGIAVNILGGQVPYRDFQCSYSPYFNYLLVLPILLWRHPLAINALFTFFDAAVLVMAFAYIKISSAGQQVRQFVLQYLLIPFVWLFLVFWNQDETICAFFLVAALWLQRRGKEDWAALVLGLGFLFTKFIFALFALAVLSTFKRKLRQTIIILAVVGAGFLPFVAVSGANVLMPLSEAGGPVIGANVWVIARFLGLQLGITANIVLLATLLVVVLLLFLPVRLIHQLSRGALDRVTGVLRCSSVNQRLVLFSLIFMVLASKTLAFYLGVFAPFLILVCLLNGSRLGLDGRITQLLYYTYGAAMPLLYYGELGLDSGVMSSVDWITGLALVVVVVAVQAIWIWAIPRSSTTEVQFTNGETPKQNHSHKREAHSNPRPRRRMIRESPE